MQTIFTKKLLALGCVFIFCTTLVLKAQPSRKGIFLVNEASRVPIAGAILHSGKASFTRLSDINGYIDLKYLPAEPGLLTIMSIGHQQLQIDPDTLRFINNTAVIQLFPRISGLAEIKVMATANQGIFKTISDLDIHLRPINNSQEVLRMVPGLFIGQHAGGGKAEQIFLRGFDLDHGTDINITVDGMPVNMVSHAHGQGYADLHFVIPELIDKVNFSKGPYYADKGNFTTAGFVELKTKDYLETNFIKVEGGQFNTLRAITGINLLKGGKDRRKQGLYFAGEGSFTKGYFESPQDFSRLNGMLKYHGNITPRHTLTTALTAFTSKWDASGQIPDRAVESGLVDFFGAIDNTEGGNTSRYNANLELLTDLNNGGKISNQVFISRYNFQLFSNFTFFKEDPVNGDQIRQQENRTIIGYNGLYQQEVRLGNITTTTRAGIQVRRDIIDDIELTRTKNRNSNLSNIMLGDVKETNAALFWEQRFLLTNKLGISGALRGDHFTNWYNNRLNGEVLSAYSFTFSPKLNINYQASDKIQLYLYNGRGFHSNDTRVAVQQDGKKVLPPAYGTDLGGMFRINKKLVLHAAAWYLWLDQEFIYVGDEGVVEAGGQSRRFGGDVSIRYEVLKNVIADIDLSLARPTALGVVKEESFLPLAPRFTSVGGLTYRKIKGFNGSLRYRYMGDRPANEDNSVVAKGYFIMDAAVNYTGKKWEAGISVQNMLNTRWKETQFDTESRLQNETDPVSEIHFTPGTPFFARLGLTLFF